MYFWLLKKSTKASLYCGEVLCIWLTIVLLIIVPADISSWPDIKGRVGWVFTISVNTF